MFCEKSVLRTFAKSTGKHMCQILFFKKVSGLKPQVFSCECCRIFKYIFFTEHLRTTASVNSVAVLLKTLKVINSLSANFTNWSNILKLADKLFECVWPFCGIRAYRLLKPLRSNKKCFQNYLKVIKKKCACRFVVKILLESLKIIFLSKL